MTQATDPVNSFHLLPRDVREVVIYELFAAHRTILDRWSGPEEDEVDNDVRTSPIASAFIDWHGNGRVLYGSDLDFTYNDCCYALVHELSHVLYGRAVNQMDPEEQDPEHLCAIMALDWVLCNSVGMLPVFWLALSHYMIDNEVSILYPGGSWAGYIGNAKDEVVQAMMNASFEDAISVGILSRADMESYTNDPNRGRDLENVGLYPAVLG